MTAFQKINNHIAQHKIDGFLVTKKENIFWLTGFWGSFGFLLINNSGQSFLVTDGRYFEKAKSLTKSNNFIPLLFDKEFSKKHAHQFSGQWFTEKSLTLSEFSWFKKLFPQIRLKSQNQIIEKLRLAKTESEINKIRTAQNQVDNVLHEFAQKHLNPGVTEREVTFKLEVALQEKGKFEIAPFDTIVCFGENTAIPHHTPSERTLQNNENVLIDCGARFGKYCSDMTRNFWVGGGCSENFKKYNQKFTQLLEAQIETISLYLPNTKVKKIDEHCRELLQEDAKYFTHSLGHGVGIEIHESPSLSYRSAEKLLLNEVVTCEPGLYYPQEFGIRIEDLILITENKPEILSQTPKELIIVK